jgi:hypothetical protein
MLLDIDNLRDENFAEATAHLSHDLSADDIDSDTLSFSGWAVTGEDAFTILMLKNTYENDVKFYLLTQTYRPTENPDICNAMTLLEYSGVLHEPMSRRELYVGEDVELIVVYEPKDNSQSLISLTRI